MHGVRFSGVLGDNICFAGNDAELPGYIMEIKDGTFEFVDNYKGTRTGRQRLFPVATVLNGKRAPARA